jgi:hypothetical protein
MHRHFDRVDTRIFNYGLIGMVRWEQPRPPCIKGQGTLRHDAMMSSTEFWRLIDRLGIPDTDALNLIGYPGKPPASGRRPRFRLTMRQTRTANALAKGGMALEAVGETSAWLRQRNRSAPFSGRAPLAVMVAGNDAGIGEIMRFLVRLAFRRSIAE